MHRHLSLLRALVALPALTLAAGCAPAAPRERVQIRTSNLSEVTPGDGTEMSATFELRTPSGTVAQTGIGLTLVATVRSPELDGLGLQATDVQWVGDHVFASYNVAGDTFAGALQVIDATDRQSPQVIAEAIYPSTDLARLRVAGQRIVAAAADPVHGGTLETFTFVQGGLSFGSMEPVGSYAATFVGLDAHLAYLTYGDVGGGVAIFDVAGDVPVKLADVPLDDARWVTSRPGGGMVTVSGSPAQISMYAGTDGDAMVTRQPVDGGNVGAPTWAQIHGDRLYLSADEAGVLIYDLDTLELLGSLPTSGTSNGSALAPGGDVAYLADGQQGLRVADVLDPTAPLELASLDVADDAGSANAVDVNGAYMALADGRGGVKILHFERHVAEPEDCDGDGVPNDDDPDDDNDGVLDEHDAAPCNPDMICFDHEVHVPVAFVGDLYNLPCDHPDVEGPITGLVMGTLPQDFDWFDDKYYAFSVERDSLVIRYGESYFPVDQGLCGDPYYFAAHWYTTAVVQEAGTYTVEMGSDDDSWLFVDGDLKMDLGGIHAIVRQSIDLELSAGAHRIDIYFAERHKVQSGLEFEVVGLPSELANISFVEHRCLDPGGDEDGDGILNAEDMAPLDPD